MIYFYDTISKTITTHLDEELSYLSKTYSNVTITAKDKLMWLDFYNDGSVTVDVLKNA